MKINTLRDFEFVEPGQVVIGTGSPRGYSIASKRSFYRDSQGGFVPYRNERVAIEVHIQRLRDCGLPVRPSTLLEEHDLAVRHAQDDDIETYRKFPDGTILVLDGLVVPQGSRVEQGYTRGFGPYYVDFSGARRGISREEAVDGREARRNIFLTRPKVVKVMKNSQVLEKNIIVPEGVYPLNFSLRDCAMFGRDQISRETGFVESVIPISTTESTPMGEEYSMFTFAPLNTMLSYPILTLDGGVGLDNNFSTWLHECKHSVRLASDEDIRPVVREFVEAGKLKEVVVVSREERFIELCGGYE